MAKYDFDQESRVKALNSRAKIEKEKNEARKGRSVFLNGLKKTLLKIFTKHKKEGDKERIEALKEKIKKL